MYRENHTQLTLPFPVMERSLNNHEMSDDTNDDRYTRTSENRRTRLNETSMHAQSEPQGHTRARWRASANQREQRHGGSFDRIVTEENNNKKYDAALIASNTVAGQPVDLDDKKKLRNKALRLLTTREHSKEELMRKLAQAKIRTALRNNTEKSRENITREKDDIEALVSSLVAQGWQSDERYAKSMVRRLSGQVSKKFIIEKLAQNGITKDAAQQAVDVIEIDDFESASTLWQRKFGVAPTDDRARQRQVRFLLSRGFHLSDAFKIVPRVKGGAERGDE